MARIVVPNQGALHLLRWTLIEATDIDPLWTLILLDEPITTGVEAVYADVVPATWAGYGPRSIQRTKWQAPAMLGDDPTAIYDVARQEWTVGVGGATVYGYAVCDTILSILLWFQIPDEPLVAEAGQLVTVWPRLAASSLIVCP